MIIFPKNKYLKLTSISLLLYLSINNNDKKKANKKSMIYVLKCRHICYPKS